MVVDRLELLPPPRSVERALDDLVDRLDQLPTGHPEVAVLRRRIEALEYHLDAR